MNGAESSKPSGENALVTLDGVVSLIRTRVNKAARVSLAYRYVDVLRPENTPLFKRTNWAWDSGTGLVKLQNTYYSDDTRTKIDTRSTQTWDGKECVHWQQRVDDSIGRKQLPNGELEDAGSVVIADRPQPSIDEFRRYLFGNPLNAEDLPASILKNGYRLAGSEVLNGLSSLVLENDRTRLWIDQRSGILLKAEAYRDKAAGMWHERIVVEEVFDGGFLPLPKKFVVERDFGPHRPIYRVNYQLELGSIKLNDDVLQADLELTLPLGALVQDNVRNKVYRILPAGRVFDELNAGDRLEFLIDEAQKRAKSPGAEDGR